MTIPGFPVQPHRPKLDQIFTDLLESVALEQLASAYLVNALAEQVKGFVGQHVDFPTQPTNQEILAFASEVSSSLTSVATVQTALVERMRILERLMPALASQGAGLETSLVRS